MEDENGDAVTLSPTFYSATTLYTASVTHDQAFIKGHGHPQSLAGRS